MRTRPTPAQLAVARERHVPATTDQKRHVEAAARDPAMALSQNHGHPAVAATSHPARFRGPGVVAAHPGRPIPAVLPTAARAARQGLATIPTPRHAEAPAAGARHVAEPTPQVTSNAPRPAEPTRLAPHQALRPHVAQPSTPMRHFAGPTGSHEVAGPRTAGMAAPTRHLLMTAPHSAFRPQPHLAAVPHPAAAPHFAAAPHPAAAPHFAAAPHPAAAPHFAAPPGGAPRGGPLGKHR